MNSTSSFELSLKKILNKYPNNKNRAIGNTGSNKTILFIGIIFNLFLNMLKL